MADLDHAVGRACELFGGSQESAVCGLFSVFQTQAELASQVVFPGHPVPFSFFIFVMTRG